LRCDTAGTATLQVVVRRLWRPVSGEAVSSGRAVRVSGRAADAVR